MNGLPAARRVRTIVKMNVNKHWRKEWFDRYYEEGIREDRLRKCDVYYHFAQGEAREPMRGKRQTMDSLWLNLMKYPELRRNRMDGRGKYNLSGYKIRDVPLPENPEPAFHAGEFFTDWFRDRYVYTGINEDSTKWKYIYREFEDSDVGKNMTKTGMAMFIRHRGYTPERIHGWKLR